MRQNRSTFGYETEMVGDRCFVTRVRPGTDAASKLHIGDEVIALDHFNVKRTMIASDLIRGCLALLLLVCRNVPQIAGVLLALSVVSCLFVPAQSITVRTLVPAF